MSSRIARIIHLESGGEEIFQLVLDWFKANPELAQALELAIGIVGFGITIYQLQKTRSAASASQEATRETLKLLSERETISDINRITSNLREVQVALQGDQIQTAQIRIQDVRFSLSELRLRYGFTTNSRKSEIQSMIVEIKKIQIALEKKSVDSSYNVSLPTVNGKLADVIAKLREWGEEIRYSTDRGETNDF